MLIIQVNDTQLEARLVQRAQMTGKPAHQIAEELLTEALDQLAPVQLSVPKLDPKQHSRLLQFDVEPSTDDAPTFGHISDTAQFASALRRNAWKR